MSKQSLSKKLNVIVETAVGSANDAIKEYHAETTTAIQKEEQLKSICGVAELRAQEAIKSVFLSIVGDMRLARINPNTIEQVKDIMYDHL